MIINETRKILKKYNLLPKKKYGQNFLIDEHVLNKIINESMIDNKMGVIEIGPGIGALTEALALRAKKVLCYEIDREMVNVLKNNLANHDNLIIINNDFMKVKLDDDIKKYLSECKDIVVIANLPYYITTPIIFKLLEEKVISKLIIMVQKEVGLRLTGRPNTKDYNALSVLMAYKTKSRLFSNVSRNSFFPAPNVDSALLFIEIIENDYNIKNEDDFLQFIRVIFSHRRKTLVNNIVSFYSCDKSKIIGIVDKLGYKKGVRSESLLIDEIVRIYKMIFE